MKERDKLVNNTAATTIMHSFGLYKAFGNAGIDCVKTAVEISAFTSVRCSMAIALAVSNPAALFSPNTPEPETVFLPL